jgi:uncharacterized sporulation protein YeaH/YhbH (DUF444 family)
MDDKISSGESEGIFNDFIKEKVKNQMDEILNNGTFEDNASEVIIEVDDITPPTFDWERPGGGGGSGDGPGDQSEKLRFTFPFEKFMEIIGQKLNLPDLTKEGKGKIKEFSHVFKTFGPSGTILDKRRTFKRAIKSSIATEVYDPENDKYDVYIRKKDKRFKLPERIEKPKYKAVCFYIGDISYSTYGERLLLEKKIVNFIYNWLDYNYGKGNVEHRYVVHDSEAYEVSQENFFKVNNAGGTLAAPAFELVDNISTNDYDPETTNLYAFYFGDGEIWEGDAENIVDLIEDKMDYNFSRIGVVEVMPTNHWSCMVDTLEKADHLKSVRVGKIQDKTEMVKLIKSLFAAKKNKNEKTAEGYAI